MIALARNRQAESSHKNPRHKESRVVRRARGDEPTQNVVLKPAPPILPASAGTYNTTLSAAMHKAIRAIAEKPSEPDVKNDLSEARKAKPTVDPKPKAKKKTKVKKAKAEAPKPKAQAKTRPNEAPKRALFNAALPSKEDGSPDYSVERTALRAHLNAWEKDAFNRDITSAELNWYGKRDSQLSDQLDRDKDPDTVIVTVSIRRVGKLVAKNVRMKRPVAYNEWLEKHSPMPAARAVPSATGRFVYSEVTMKNKVAVGNADLMCLGFKTVKQLVPDSVDTEYAKQLSEARSQQSVESNNPTKQELVDPVTRNTEEPPWNVDEVIPPQADTSQETEQEKLSVVAHKLTKYVMIRKYSENEVFSTTPVMRQHCRAFQRELQQWREDIKRTVRLKNRCQWGYVEGTIWSKGYVFTTPNPLDHPSNKLMSARANFREELAARKGDTAPTQVSKEGLSIDEELRLCFAALGEQLHEELVTRTYHNGNSGHFSPETLNNLQAKHGSLTWEQLQLSKKMKRRGYLAKKLFLQAVIQPLQAKHQHVTPKVRAYLRNKFVIEEANRRAEEYRLSQQDLQQESLDRWFEDRCCEYKAETRAYEQWHEKAELNNPSVMYPDAKSRLYDDTAYLQELKRMARANELAYLFGALQVDNNLGTIDQHKAPVPVGLPYFSFDDNDLPPTAAATVQSEDKGKDRTDDPILLNAGGSNVIPFPGNPDSVQPTFLVKLEQSLQDLGLGSIFNFGKAINCFSIHA